LDQAIRDQASSFTPAQRSRWEERSHTLPVEERSLAWWAGLDHQDREQVQRAATVMRPVFDAEVVAFAVHDAERARSVVVAVHMPTFVAQVGAALGNHPTLVRLATAVRG